MGIDLVFKRLFLELEGGRVMVKDGRRSDFVDLAGLCVTLLPLLFRFAVACPLLLSEAIEAIASCIA